MGIWDLPWLKYVRLIRGFVFKSVFGQRPDLCKRLLETVLDVEIAEVELVQSEREMDAVEKRRGGRVDLYIVDGEGNRYDVEVQTKRREDEWLRARHYQALMDVNQLKRGTDASDLHSSIVLFICDFDPFARGFMRYDCATVCLQTGTVVPDRRSSIYLNIYGDTKGVSAGLRNLARLFRGEAVDNDGFVREIVGEMQRCVDNPEWMEQFMTLEEEMEAEKEAAREEGRKEGCEEGRKEGRKAGRKEAYNQVAVQNARLVDALRDAGRLDELPDAMSNTSTREALLVEFGIAEEG